MAAVQISLPHYQYEVLTIPSHVVFQHLTSYNYLSDTQILLSQIDIHDVKTTTLRCGKPEEDDKETAGEDDSASDEGTPEEDCARAALTVSY